MSEPNVEWYIERVKELLHEIDRLIHSPVITESIKDIISYDTNEIEINLHAIIRKLRASNENAKLCKALRCIRDSLQRDEANCVYISDIKWFSQDYMSKSLTEWIDGILRE